MITSYDNVLKINLPLKENHQIVSKSDCIIREVRSVNKHKLDAIITTIKLK